MLQNKIGNQFNRPGRVLMKKGMKFEKRNIISEVFTDYCSHASLHGIGYLGAKDKTLSEKIWWMVIFISSLTVCIYLITDTWIKWKHNPVMLSFEKEQTPIWAIPFPAVTICPLNKVRQTVYNYTDMFRRRHNLTGDEYNHFWDISLICNLEQYNSSFESTRDIINEEAIQNIFSVSPRIDDILYYAKWQDIEDVDIFSEHLNKEGLCYTFNSLIKDSFSTKIDTDLNHDGRSTKWTMENGYESNSKLNDYPRRTAQVGFESGLSFILDSYISDEEYVCGIPMSGYKIILHNPAETAKAAQQYFLVNSNTIATIMVTPDLTTTSTSLRSLSAHERKCYFSNEKTLRFFEVYTQNNCRVECDANITEHYCGCVPFYMPRHVNTLICGFGKMKCIEEIKRKILDLQMIEQGKNVIEEIMETTIYKIYDKCDCLPACNNLQFRAEISSTKIQYVESALAAGIEDKQITQEQQEHLQKRGIEISQVDIFFKESEFLALRRTELYGTTNFIASCGGLLGLFLGFSILSLVEIIYFLTLRIWCKIRSKN